MMLLEETVPRVLKELMMVVDEAVEVHATLTDTAVELEGKLAHVSAIEDDLTYTANPRSKPTTDGVLTKAALNSLMSRPVKLLPKLMRRKP